MSPYMKEMGRRLVQLVYANDYYVKLFEQVLRDHGVATFDIVEGKLTPYGLSRVANAFWMALPDSPAIQRSPFGLLCDMAEYDEDEDGTQG